MSKNVVNGGVRENGRVDWVDRVQGPQVRARRERTRGYMPRSEKDRVAKRGSRRARCVQ